MINCFFFSISYWHRKFEQDKVEKKLETDNFFRIVMYI